jgi:glycosyltransferase involved in cell wall biosynthesis
MNISDSFNPFFSIIIPTYNRAQELERCLQSLAEQTYKNFEVLICDDGSTDNTTVVVSNFKERLNINHIWNENWGGPARPRNIGIRASLGKWICFLDSDDWWYSNKLECIYNRILEKPKIDVICHDLIVNNKIKKKEERFRCGPIKHKLYQDLLLNGNKFANSAISVKKEVIKAFNITINESKNAISVEDYDFLLKLAYNNAVFSCLNIPLGEYVIENNNISQTGTHLKNLESILREHVFKIQSFELNKKKLWRNVNARLEIIKGACSIKHKRYFESIKHYLLAMIKSKKIFIKYIFELIS